MVLGGRGGVLKVLVGALWGLLGGLRFRTTTEVSVKTCGMFFAADLSRET